MWETDLKKKDLISSTNKLQRKKGGREGIKRDLRDTAINCILQLFFRAEFNSMNSIHFKKQKQKESIYETTVEI